MDKYLDKQFGEASKAYLISLILELEEHLIMVGDIQGLLEKGIKLSGRFWGYIGKVKK